MYDDPTPLPGSSISMAESDYTTGTLCGYVRHGPDIFALTNHHVLFESANAPYRYVDGQQEKRFVNSPSNADYRAITDGHQFSVDALAECLGCLQRQLQRRIADGLDFEPLAEKTKATQDALLEQIIILNEAQNYNRRLGYVVATSGLAPPARSSDPRLDWALIQCDTDGGRLFRNMVSSHELRFLCKA